jgi:hypothetical protein
MALLAGHGCIKVAVLATHVQGAVQRVHIVPDFRQPVSYALGFMEQVGTLKRRICAKGLATERFAKSALTLVGAACKGKFPPWACRLAIVGAFAT